MAEKTGQGKGRKPAEQVQMGCLTQTQSAGRSRGSPGVAGTSVAAAAAVVVVVVVAAAAAVGGTTAVAAVGVAIPLVVGRAGAEPVVAPVILAVDATIQLAVEPIASAWLLVEPVVATG